jgi:hypothetical protein
MLIPQDFLHVLLYDHWKYSVLDAFFVQSPCKRRLMFGPHPLAPFNGCRKGDLDTVVAAADDNGRSVHAD